MAGDRIARIEELLKEEVSKLILKEDFGAIITVTKADVTPDLRSGRIWVSVLGGNPDDALQELSKKQGGFQKIINKKLSLKYVPKITFNLDHSGEYAQKIQSLFNEIKEKNDSSGTNSQD
jgi:ribosome-binding factor A